MGERSKVVSSAVYYSPNLTTGPAHYLPHSVILQGRPVTGCGLVEGIGLSTPMP